MKDVFARTSLLLGKNGMEKLNNARVAVFGIGGVGGYTAEALARSGVGTLDIIDSDTVSITNINRQIFALRSTVGEYKVDAAESRLKDINPDIVINKHKLFYSAETSDLFNLASFDYIVDAIDTVSAKIELIVRAAESGTPIISSMGAGNKLDPAAFKVADIYSTSVCPLAKVMRRELKKRGIERLKVVYSEEPPIFPDYEEDDEKKGTGGRFAPGSIAFVPSVVGLIIAGEVIKDIALKENNIKKER